MPNRKTNNKQTNLSNNLMYVADAYDVKKKKEKEGGNQYEEFTYIIEHSIVLS